MHKSYNAKMYKHSSKNLSREEKISRENEALLLRVKNQEETIKTLAERKSTDKISQPPIIIEKVVEKIIVKEVLVEKAVPKVVEKPKTQEVVFEVEGGSKTEKEQPIVTLKEENKVSIKEVRAGVRAGSRIAQAFMGIVLAVVCFGFFMSIMEEKSQGTTVGIPRATVAAKNDISDMPVEKPAVAEKLPVVVANLPVEKPTVSLSSDASPYKYSVHKERVEEALTNDAIQDAKAKKRRQDLASLSDQIAESANNLEKVQNNASTTVDSLRKRCKTKSETLRKKGKDKEADKLVAKTEKDIEVILRKSKDKADKISTAMQEAQRDADALMAEDKKYREDDSRGRIEEVKKQSGPQVASTITEVTPVNHKEDRFVYIIILKGNPLVIRQVVDGKVSEKALVISKIGRYSYAKYNSGVGLQVERQGDNKPIIGGKEFFVSGRWFWVFDGERMVRKATVPSDVFKKLTNGES